MRNFTLKLSAAVLALGAAASANAAIATLDSRVAVAGGNQFNYTASLGSDEGLRAGSRLIIFDFGGYVPGSVFASLADFAASTELSSATPFITPGQTDDAGIENLVFTYTGADFRNIGGPFAMLDLSGFGAVSTFFSTKVDAFTSFTVKNNPVPVENSLVTTLGVTQTPGVPEPSAWALLLVGFGAIGVMARRRTAGTLTA